MSKNTNEFQGSECGPRREETSKCLGSPLGKGQINEEESAKEAEKG